MPNIYWKAIGSPATSIQYTNKWIPNDGWDLLQPGTGKCGYVYSDQRLTASVILDDNGKFTLHSDASNLFKGCGTSRFISPENWDTSYCTKMDSMFEDCPNLGYIGGTSFYNITFANWDTSNVTSMKKMFKNCIRLRYLDLSGWDTSKVTDMSEMFYDSYLSKLYIPTFEVPECTNFYRMFYDCASLERIYAKEGSDWDTEIVTNSTQMFRNCNKIPTWDGVIDITRANNTKGGYFDIAKAWYQYDVFEKNSEGWTPVNVYMKDSDNWGEVIVRY